MLMSLIHGIALWGYIKNLTRKIVTYFAKWQMHVEVSFNDE